MATRKRKTRCHHRYLAAFALLRERQARREALEEAAKIAENPYSDEVGAINGDGCKVTGARIAAAIRALAEKGDSDDQP